MCGRFTLTANFRELKDRFGFEMEERDWHPRYNIAPGQEVLTVVESKGKRQGIPMLWGLVPHWAKDRKIGYRMINARAETLAEKSSFRNCFKAQRCLIPADGFYEWKERVPYRICRKDRALFAFAGLWDLWRDEEGNELGSCTIITTSANELLQTVHDRMPVILRKKAEQIWLDPNQTKTETLERWLEPYPVQELEMYEVAPLVNSWKNDVPECITPIQ